MNYYSRRHMLQHPLASNVSLSDSGGSDTNVRSQRLRNGRGMSKNTFNNRNNMNNANNKNNSNQYVSSRFKNIRGRASASAMGYQSNGTNRNSNENQYLSHPNYRQFHTRRSAEQSHAVISTFDMVLFLCFYKLSTNSHPTNKI